MARRTNGASMFLLMGSQKGSDSVVRHHSHLNSCGRLPGSTPTQAECCHTPHRSPCASQACLKTHATTRKAASPLVHEESYSLHLKGNGDLKLVRWMAVHICEECLLMLITTSSSTCK